jgi:TolB-like protein
LEVVFAFGEHRLDIERRELRRGGELVGLEPQVFDVLAYLVRHRDRVVSHEDLREAVWGGRIVSYSALASRINAVRRALDDDGTTQRFVRTFARKGVRFVGEVKELPERTVPDATEAAQAAGGQPSNPTLPEKPSLAVLPFQNMTGDPEQDYFVDGMVEEITTAIARLPWLFVIARNSSFTYKGKSVDVKQVARELGVRYLLEGSVRKTSNRVRITGQLIDTARGVHIWGARFDGELGDIFDLQDDIASSVAGAIEPKLRQAEIEHAHRKPTANLNAYDLYLRALAQFYKVTYEGNREALGLLDRALALDNVYAPAAAMAAMSWAARKYHAWAPVSEQEMAQAVGLAKTAIELGKQDPDALSRAAWALSFFTGDLATGSRAVERALALNPNSAVAWSTRGWMLVWVEDPEQGLQCFDRAMRLSPLDPWLFSQQYGIARCHFVMGRFDEALRWADKSLLEQPRAVNVTAFKLGVCGHLGLEEETRNCLLRLHELSPGFSVTTFIRQVIPRGVSSRIVSLWADGLRKAGVPEE